MTPQHTLPPGATFFLRCADCHELFQPMVGWNWQTGETVVCWTRPRPARKPVRCDHRGVIERWDGAAWVATMPLKDVAP